jgi:hypothetical protein
MNIPPNAHAVLGVVFLAFAVFLALANWGRRRAK